MTRRVKRSAWNAGHAPRDGEWSKMEDSEIARQALFEGLVYNEHGERAKVAFIGGVAHYAMPDGDFLRHVEARAIDDAVMAQLKEQITSQKEELVRGMLQMLGKDDIFTKAALDASIRNIDQQVRQSDRSQWGPWLQLLGFRVVADVHGNVVQIIYPQQSGESGGDDE
jgi:hypothetical protein